MISHASLAVIWLVLGYRLATRGGFLPAYFKICIMREEFVGANQDKDTMAEATTALRRKPISSFKKWFLEGHVKEVEGPHEKEGQHPRTARRHQDRVVLHRLDHHRLIHIPRVALDGVAR